MKFFSLIFCNRTHYCCTGNAATDNVYCLLCLELKGTEFCYYKALKFEEVCKFRLLNTKIQLWLEAVVVDKMLE